MDIINRIKKIFDGSERTKVVKKNIAGSFLIKGLGIIISLLLVPFTIHLLDQEKYGIWMAIFSIFIWFNMMEVGIGNGLRNKFAAAIALGKQDCLYLGNLNSQRDLGHAKDYVEAMWRILQQDLAIDYVITTGVTTYFRDFVRLSFAEVGIALAFEGENENEIAKIEACNHPDYQLPIGTVVVRVDPQYYRPTGVDLLLGDPSKYKKLGWKTQYDLAGLVKEMVASDLEIMKRVR